MKPNRLPIVDRVVGGQGDEGAQQQHAILAVALQRHHQRRRPVRQLALLHVQLGAFGDAAVPFRRAHRLQRQRLDGADAVDGLHQHRAFGRFRGVDLAYQRAQRLQEAGDDEGNAGGGHDDGPGQRHVKVEQDRQQQDHHEHVEKRVHQLAGEEGAHLVDLADPVGQLARLVLLEELHRQGQQPVEDHQIEPGIQLGRQDHLEQLAAPAQYGLESHHDHQDHHDQFERVEAVILDHRADRAHHQHDRHDTEDGESDGGDGDVAQHAPLRPHHAGQHVEVEGCLILNAVAGGADQQRSTAPHLLQPQLIHRHRRLVRQCPRVAQHQHALLLAAPDHQGGPAIV